MKQTAIMKLQHKILNKINIHPKESLKYKLIIEKLSEETNTTTTNIRDQIRRMEQGNFLSGRVLDEYCKVLGVWS